MNDDDAILVRKSPSVETAAGIDPQAPQRESFTGMKGTASQLSHAFPM